MKEYGSSGSTPRALGPQGARRTGLGGKHERAAAIVGQPQISGCLAMRARARPGLQIDLKSGLSKQLTVVRLGNFGDDRSSGCRELGPRFTGTIGTITQHFFDSALSCRFA